MNEPKLDKLDFKILHELDLNSRQPYANIAKKISTSKEVVFHRIRKLEESKVIRLQ